MYRTNPQLRVQDSLIQQSQDIHVIFKNLFPHFQEVYELAVWTKRFQMLHSTCQSDLTVVHQVYDVGRPFKVVGPVRPNR